MGQDIPEETKDSDEPKLFGKAAKKRSKKDSSEESLAMVEEKDEESRLEDIKSYQEVLGKEGIEPSAMSLLRGKELELKGERLEAEKQAEIRVADARRKAQKIRTDADEMAVAEAKKYFDKEIDKAKKEAEVIRNSVGNDIESVNSTGQKNINEGVKLVMKVLTLQE